ncbi:hypothetical protein [Chamaesiphon minutus]|nr:hypothetical protein [Chamaesiphon minutus]
MFVIGDRERQAGDLQSDGAYVRRASTSDRPESSSQAISIEQQR